MQRPRLALALAITVLAPLAGGCRGQDATITNRLWVSAMPKSTTSTVTAFVTSRTVRKTSIVGFYYQGSAARGAHDAFTWKDVGPNEAVVKFVQDGRSARLSFSPCKPIRGFDRCLEVQGDPTGTERYYSRARWGLRTRGSAQSALAEIVASDRDLARAWGLE